MLGIVTTTKDRSEFVIRLLYYYAKMKCPYTIYIGDSSEEKHIQHTKAAIEKLNGKIKIVYELYPGMSGPATMNKLLELFQEKYVAFIGDDDYLVPKSLAKGILFLETHPEYSTAQGKGIIFSLDRKGAYGNIESLGEYLLKDNEHETPSQRLFQYLKEGWNSEFSVHRTEEFVEACEKRDTLPDSGICETLSNSVTVIQGKSKQIDCLYLFRQVHPQRHFNPAFFERLISPNWYPSYQIYRQQITKALEKHEGLSSEEASEVAEQAFFQLLTALMKKTLNRISSSEEPKFSIRQMVKRLPGTTFVYSRLRGMIPGNHEEFQLPRLLSSSSPFHEDFIPVYEVVTSSEKALESELFG
jgi:glycosyltransferase domain-containing protein